MLWSYGDNRFDGNLVRFQAKLWGARLWEHGYGSTVMGARYWEFDLRLMESFVKVIQDENKICA